MSKRFARRSLRDGKYYIGVDVLDNCIEYILDRKDEFVDKYGEIDDDALDRVINEEFDNILIYNDDIWKIMAHYQNPQDADYDSAIEEAYDDVSNIIRDEA